jgi:hypothetical protein
MPNWVENEVTFKSSREKLDIIENKVRKTINTMENGEQVIQDLTGQLFPMPKELEKLVGTDDNIRRFKDLDGNVVRIPQMEAITYFQMNEDDLLGHGYTMETLSEDELKELDDKYGAHDWYNWNIKNYGTKWGDCETSLKISDKEKLVYTFESAWSPAFQFIEYVAKEFKLDVEYKYFSLENGDKGSINFNQQGVVIKQTWEMLDESYFKFMDDVENPKGDAVPEKELQDSENPF